MQKAMRYDTDVVFTCAPQHTRANSVQTGIVTDSFFICHHYVPLLAYVGYTAVRGRRMRNECPLLNRPGPFGGVPKHFSASFAEGTKRTTAVKA
jgi:hypothetical protein